MGYGTGRDRGNEKQNPSFALLTEEHHDKPLTGWSALGFENGTYPMRVSCLNSEPLRSVNHCLVISKLPSTN